MRISLKAEHLKFYKDIIQLLIKYRHSDLVRAGALASYAPKKDTRAVARVS